MLTLRESLKQNWLGLLVGVFGIAVGLLVSYYFYSESLRQRQPVFLVDPVRTEILDSDRLTETAIKVSRLDGTEITGDLTSVKFYLWNDGEESIRKEHVLVPISISLEDPEGEILDFKLLSVSREVTDFKLDRTDDFPLTTLGIDFLILEHNDGATGQIIYQGNPTARFTITGTIEGVGQFQTNESIAASRFWYQYSFIWVVILVFGVLFGLLCLLSKLGEKVEQTWWPRLSTPVKRILRWFFKALGILILGGFVAAIIYALFIGPIEPARQRANRGVVQEVPSTILP